MKYFKRISILVIILLMSISDSFSLPIIQKLRNRPSNRWTRCISKKINAGILPYAWKDGEPYVLIGREGNGQWADFGGRPDPEDCTSLDTAMREFGEETRYGFVRLEGQPWYVTHHKKKKLKKRDIKRLLKENNKYIAPRLVQKKFSHPRGYDMFLVKVDKVPEDIFNNAPRVPHYEKTKHEWVPAQEFIVTVKNQSDRHNTYYGKRKIRPSFVDVIKAHDDELLDIIKGYKN